MLKKLLFLGIASQSLLFCGLSEENVTRRVYDHLLLSDVYAATREAREGLKIYPESRALQEALIRSLCEQGEEMEALETWKKTTETFGELKEDRKLLEALAWGVLNKGERSSQLSIRMSALVGAALTHDAKAVPLLLQEMRGSSALLRSLAIKLSASFGDGVLQKELLRLLEEERIWYVRLEVIEVIGQLRMQNAKEKLKEIVACPKTLIEEKFAAICALVNTYEKVDKAELQGLIASDRSGLRDLACQLVLHLNDTPNLSLLFPLLKDASSSVRASALNTIGLLHPEGSLKEEVKALFNDPSPEVAITAAWVATVFGEKEGKKLLTKWILGDVPEWRRLAAAALAATGEEGVKPAIKLMKITKDPYVLANLALGLIGQREKTEFACEMLYSALSSTKREMWMWDSGYNPLFRSLAPSQVRHIDQIPNYPKVIDELVRLDLLTILSMLRFSKAEVAVKELLQNVTWGISGSAAATLLEEGEEEAADLVRALLTDPEEKLRLQAALIMALIGNDPSAINILKQAYPNVDREMKIHILEAIGHLGEQQSIPFLLGILGEPFQLLRVVSARALIQCLYH